MKQSEKTQRTKERILNAAIAEFGTKSYETASINTICHESQLSKGLLYHNFKSKDELYLLCVRLCYDQLTEYLKTQESQAEDVRQSLQNLLALRQKFFSDNPYYANIFFNSLLLPPRHLLSRLREIRQEFDAFCTQYYCSILQNLPLREGITQDMALEYFSIFSEMFNGYFQRKADLVNDYHAFIDDHEGKLSSLLDIMLYGIAEDNIKKEKL